MIAKCVTLPEGSIKYIDPKDFNKNIMDPEKSLINLKELIPDVENSESCYAKGSIENLCEIIKESLNDQEILLFVGSKKISYANELNQELEYTKYFLVYLIIAFKLLNRGGSLVLRTYDLHMPFSSQLVFLLSNNFEQITIMKPLSSNLHSAERFIVATNFLYEGQALKDTVAQLYGLLDIVKYNENEGKVLLSMMNLEYFQNQSNFKTYIQEENSRIDEWRIQSLKNLLDFIKHPNRELDGKDKVKDRCLELWGVPILHSAEEKERRKTQMIYVNSDDEEKDDFLVLLINNYIGTT